MVLVAMGLIGFLGVSAGARFLRAGSPVTISVKRAGGPQAGPEVLKALGLTVRDLTPADRAMFRWDDSVKGVMVSGGDGHAWHVIGGLAQGDAVQEIDGEPVTDVRSFEAAAAKAVAKADERTSVVMRRGLIGDYQHYFFAARAVIQGEDIYRQHVNCYGYLPMFAISQVPLVGLGPRMAAATWAVLCAVFTGAAVWLGAREVLRRLMLPHGIGAVAPVVAVTTLIMWDKTRADFRLGQTDAPILLAFVIGLCCVGRLPGLAGWCMGFIANFKYQSLAFLPYFLVRRRWSAAFWSVASSLAFAFGGALIWGWETNQRYLRDTLGALFRMLGSKQQLSMDEGVALYGLSWHRSVSVPSTLARAADAMGLPTSVALLVTGLIAAGSFALGWWLFFRRGQNLFAGREPRLDDASPTRGALMTLEWAGLIVATLVFSPQSTARHFFLMYLPVLVATALFFHLRDRVARIAVGVALLLMLGSLTLPPGQGDEVINPFRIWGVPSWAALVLYFTTLWAGIEHIAGMERTGESVAGAKVAVTPSREAASAAK